LRRSGLRWLAPLAEAGLRVLPRVPAGWLVAVGRAGSWIAFPLERRRRRRMREGVAIAFPERFPTRASRRRLARESLRQLHRSVLEAALAVLHAGERERVRCMPVEGREHLEKALARGRGAVVVSAHLGAFTLVPIRLAALHPVSLVANRPDDERMAAWLDACLARVEVDSVPVRPSRVAARASLAALRQGRILVVLADEFKAGGVPVKFLGHAASAPRGPATLALRTGAALLPAFAVRDERDRPRLEIGPEIELVRSDDPVADVASSTALVCAAIEARVRRVPEQWSWANFRLRPRAGAAKFAARPAARGARSPSA
jgi:KDO2-lipid IV(A) lauroyltransferase